jgi:hypothetical protein
VMFRLAVSVLMDERISIVGPVLENGEAVAIPGRRFVGGVRCIDE